MNKKLNNGTLIRIAITYPVIFILLFVTSFITMRGCIKIGKHIDKVGIKSIVEEVWEGKNKN